MRSWERVLFKVGLLRNYYRLLWCRLPGVFWRPLYGDFSLAIESPGFCVFLPSGAVRFRDAVCDASSGVLLRVELAPTSGVVLCF